MSADVHDKILTDLGTLTGALTLSGVAGVIDDVQGTLVQLLGEQTAIPAFPYVLVHAEDEPEEDVSSDFTYDHVVYKGLVEIVDQLQPNFQARRKTYQTWRRQIAAMLRGRVNPPVLPTATEAYDVRVTLRPLVTKADGSAQLVRTGVLVRVWTREARQRN